MDHKVCCIVLYVAPTSLQEPEHASKGESGFAKV